MSPSIFADLSHFGLLEFSGEGAQSFLNGQLSCDVVGLSPWHAQYGSYSTPQGRMLASFLLWRAADTYCMQLPRNMCDLVRKRIAMFILRSKVKVTDVSNGWTLFGVAGTNAAQAIKKKLGQVPSAPMEMTTTENVFILRLDATRFQLIVAADHAPQISNTVADETTPASHAAWDLLDIRAGIPFITPKTQEQFVPQMTNLDLIGGVSFSKGCYPGQEIVARTHYRGKLKQRMYLARIDTANPPHAGDKVFSSDLGAQAAGTIINAAPAPEGGYDALAVLQIESAAGGDTHWKSLEGPQLQLRPLPYEIPA